MRVVIDTNIWVSGLLWRGSPWRLLKLAERGEIEVCMSPRMLDELARVLTYERLQPRLEQLGLTPADLVAYAANLAMIFEVPEGGRIVAADPDDDVFLHCALVAGADCVISGDRHLLDLGEYGHLSVLAVDDFLDEFHPSEE